MQCLKEQMAAINNEKNTLNFERCSTILNETPNQAILRAQNSMFGIFKTIVDLKEQDARKFIAVVFLVHISVQSHKNTGAKVKYRHLLLQIITAAAYALCNT